MATSAATASTSGSSFARLVSRSKVVSQYDPSIPLVYTSHGGSLKRSDFGLKRSLPKLKSPAIRVTHLDSPITKLTDFNYGSREIQYVKRWSEAGIGVLAPPQSTITSNEGDRRRGASEAPGGCTWDRSTFQDIEELKAVAQTGLTKKERLALDQSRKSQSARPIDYLSMSREDFEDFLDILKKHRYSYKKFVKDSKADAFKTVDDPDLLDDLRACVSVAERTDAGNRIDAFLLKLQERGAFTAMGSTDNTATADPIQSKPHIGMGLSYVPANLYQSDVTSRPVPGRVLDVPKIGALRSGRSQPTSVLGQVSLVRQDNLGGVQTSSFRPDSDGNLNTNYGEVLLRVEAAHRGQLRSVNTTRLGDGPYDEPLHAHRAEDRDTSTILDKEKGPFEMTYYRAERGIEMTPWRDPTQPIGSQKWVASPTASRDAGFGNRSTASLFGLSVDSTTFERYNLSPPRADEFTTPSLRSIPRRSQWRRQQADPDPFDSETKLHYDSILGKPAPSYSDSRAYV
ncbi:hypothetical protein EMMF5_006320 [Cystobasidiomycetes sp. EMM_F5]